MKRFTKVLLALVFVLGAFLPFAGGKSASATGEEKYIVSSPAVTKKTESVYLKTNQNGSQTQISAKEFEVLKKEVKSQYNKNQKEVIYNTGSKNFTSKNDIKPNAPVNVI
ncbi:hypothetical protein [Bacillus sp. V2I10]|uniref:hypothetical protein n=1 Tax=Bacillus sp. V2I10 TaxID=3042276 RepID=UPI00278713E0|nr:hypothetical protein [Bacillus sp. V2I10]MDQ0860909.1 hypothetical protein [Bacillus sp. V2I10]